MVLKRFIVYLGDTFAQSIDPLCFIIGLDLDSTETATDSTPCDGK